MADQYTAFAGHRLLASGDASDVAAAAKAAQDAGEPRVLIFNDATGEQAELDPREPVPTIASRASTAPAKPGRGRPKLGVVAREVTLLPRRNARGCQEQITNLLLAIAAIGRLRCAPHASRV